METLVKNDSSAAVGLKRSVTIDLIVMANDLYHTDPATEKDIDNSTSLFDGSFGSPFRGSKRDFESNVYQGKYVCWHGKVNDPNGEDAGYTIELLNVTNASSRFFGTTKLLPGRDGDICGNVKVDSGEESYTLEFTITPPIRVGKPKSYTLDPKLKANG